MAETEEDTAVYIDWDFRPYLPIRIYESGSERFLRENIFVLGWQKLMTHQSVGTVLEGAIVTEDQFFVDNESYRYPILDVFNGVVPSAHDTRIASNFILYLGWGNGIAYLDNASKLSEIFGNNAEDRAKCYLAQWAMECNPMELWGSASPRFDLAKTNSDQQEMFYAPRYSDLMTLERMAYWCGTDQGQEFIANCEHIIKRITVRTYPKETPAEIRRRKIIADFIGLSL